MAPNRKRSLPCLFVLLALITLSFLADRMILRRETFLKSRYTDQVFAELMEELIHREVFKRADGMIFLDEEALAGCSLKKRTEWRVKESIPFLFVQDGGIRFDRRAVSVSSHYVNREDRVLRGTIFDRNGVVLARSVYDTALRAGNLVREYPYGPEFFPIVGHCNPVFGNRNLERELDGFLTGNDGGPVVRRCSFFDNEIRVGDDVMLTLDSALQRVAYAAMDGKKGAVVALDVRTGEILCLVSSPSFDPNTKEWNRWREAFKDNNRRPYENRGLSALYPPGSTFKTVVASAWLEQGKSEEHKITCRGTKNRFGISDIHPHGSVDFKKAFQESCNQFFGDIGVRLGKRLAEQAARFGFNQDLDLLAGLKGHCYKAEASLAFSWNDHGNGRRAVTQFSNRDFTSNPKIVAQGAIGQNIVTATPLQMALIASTIANGGVMLAPQILKQITKGDRKEPIFTSGPAEIGRAITEPTAEKIAALMKEVMQRGTGKAVKKIYSEDGRYTTSPEDANAGAVPVAGKTGTAEVGDKNGNRTIDPDEKPHSWFIGFAPASQPRVAIAVIAENEGFGSLTAAPIAMDVLAEALNQGEHQEIPPGRTY